MDVLALVYADDLVLLSDTFVMEQRMTKILADYVKGKGLCVNMKKTQFVVCKQRRSMAKQNRCSERGSHRERKVIHHCRD